MALAQIKLLHIPYKGAGQAMNDALGGQVDAITDNLPSALPHIKSGKLRALAVLSEKRSPALPDVPTYGELGFPQMGGGGWFGVVAPAGTPPEIVAKLNAGLPQGHEEPRVHPQDGRVRRDADPQHARAVRPADPARRWSATSGWRRWRRSASTERALSPVHPAAAHRPGACRWCATRRTAAPGTPTTTGHAVPLPLLRARRGHARGRAVGRGAGASAARCWPRTFRAPTSTPTAARTTSTPSCWTRPGPRRWRPARRRRLGFGLVWRNIRAGVPIYDRQLTVAEVQAAHRALLAALPRGAGRVHRAGRGSASARSGT